MAEQVQHRPKDEAVWIHAALERQTILRSVEKSRQPLELLGGAGFGPLELTQPLHTDLAIPVEEVSETRAQGLVVHRVRRDLVVGTVGFQVLVERRQGTYVRLHVDAVRRDAVEVLA